MNNHLEAWWRGLSWVQRRRLRSVFRPAKGRALDNIGAVFGVARRGPSRWWPFNESDKAYRARILGTARG